MPSYGEQFINFGRSDSLLWLDLIVRKPVFAVCNQVLVPVFSFVLDFYTKKI